MFPCRCARSPQVLDFSRIIHEDLSNYDQSSSWAVLLDEFVELLHAQHGGRSVGMMGVSLGPWKVDVGKHHVLTRLLLTNETHVRIVSCETLP